MDNGIYSDYFMYVAPAVGLTIVFLVLTLVVGFMAERSGQRKVRREIHKHLDENTKEQIRTWQSEVQSLKAENVRLRKRCQELSSMVRGALGVLSGLDSEAPGMREDNDE